MSIRFHLRRAAYACGATLFASTACALLLATVGLLAAVPPSADARWVLTFFAAWPCLAIACGLAAHAHTEG